MNLDQKSLEIYKILYKIIFQI